MRLAYADPVYLGQAKRYPEHPESHIFDDLATHRDLLARLDRDYDGWAYSLSSTTLAAILPVAPPCRVAAWVKPFRRVQAECSDRLHMGGRPIQAGARLIQGRRPRGA